MVGDVSGVRGQLRVKALVIWCLQALQDSSRVTARALAKTVEGRDGWELHDTATTLVAAISKFSYRCESDVLAFIKVRLRCSVGR